MIYAPKKTVNTDRLTREGVLRDCDEANAIDQIDVGF